MRAGGYSGVNLDANLAVRIEAEMFFGEGEKIFDLFGCQVGGSATAPVELDNGTILRDATANALHFLLQDVKIRRGDRFVLLTQDGACAKQTKAFAQKDMHGKPNRP